MKNYLFVYGTLRKSSEGLLHPYLNETAIFVSQAYLRGRLFQIKDYPGAIPHPASKRDLVHGEVYKLLRPKRVLSLLDQYEECAQNFPGPHEYRRSRTTVTLSDGKRLQAWIYWFCLPTAGYRRIPGGDYFAYLITTTAKSELR